MIMAYVCLKCENMSSAIDTAIEVSEDYGEAFIVDTRGGYYVENREPLPRPWESVIHRYANGVRIDKKRNPANTYEVTVMRATYAYVTISVEAESDQEASEKAIALADEDMFSEEDKAPEYEVTEIK